MVYRFVNVLKTEPFLSVTVKTTGNHILGNLRAECFSCFEAPGSVCGLGFVMKDFAGQNGNRQCYSHPRNLDLPFLRLPVSHRCFESLCLVALSTSSIQKLLLTLNLSMLHSSISGLSKIGAIFCYRS